MLLDCISASPSASGDFGLSYGLPFCFQLSYGHGDPLSSFQAVSFSATCLKTSRIICQSWQSTERPESRHVLIVTNNSGETATFNSEKSATNNSKTHTHLLRKKPTKAKPDNCDEVSRIALTSVRASFFTRAGLQNRFVFLRTISPRYSLHKGTIYGGFTAPQVYDPLS